MHDMEKCKVLITPNDWCGLEEWYIPVIECPKCGHKVPARFSNYCNGCGVKLKITPAVKDFIENSWL